MSSGEKSLLDKLIIPQTYDLETESLTVTSMVVNVKASTPDPLRAGKRIESQWTKLTVQPETTLKNLISQFQKTNSDFVGYEFLVKYNNRLFKSGTVQECGITNKSNIELVSLSSEQSALKNQGFILSYWSLVPMMLALSFLIGSLVGTYNIYLRGVFFLIGSIMLIPSVVCFVIGISEVFPALFKVSFVNYIWFGPCCDCCYHNKDADDFEEDEEIIDVQV
ncbi:hypothetical protein GPJ56_006535 [Histomonas meleagridis]|uniref:uncharacterized protein n=1 Tax=Histomonas meleagridis TaxID=135588 RepID=UPI00355A6D97|nr:hypothetical protein GPJ56_006535 [Histomonas meleagridis]KAH0801772.1 hypothetical protein GO595_005453 [Histomonas meleagridis]